MSVQRTYIVSLTWRYKAKWQKMRGYGQPPDYQCMAR